MATEFDNSLHWGLFLTGTTLTSETGKYVRVSELVLSALRAAGVFSNMVDGIAAPATDKLWLDKNFDPAVLKEWDATGASWVPMTYGRLFGRAAVDKLTVTGGTGDAVVVSQPAGFQADRLYLMTPTAGNSGAATINVSGVGTYAVKYGDGADLSATEFTAGRQAVLFFTGSRFEVVFPLSGLSSAVIAAQAAQAAAEAAAATFLVFDEDDFASNSSTRPPSQRSTKVYIDNKVPVTSVLDHGAVGDGVTDDTDAIQAAIDAAPEGTVVLFPKAHYYFTNLESTKALVLDFANSDLTVAPGLASLSSALPAVWFRGALATARFPINTVSETMNDRVVLTSGTASDNFATGDYVELLDTKPTKGWDETVVTAVTVGAGGSGYTNGQFVELVATSGVGTNACGTVAVTAGAVTGVTITSGGEGFAVSDTLNIVSTLSAGSGATATVSTIGGSVSTTYSGRKQVARVKSTSGSTVYLDQSVEWDYDGATATIARLNMLDAPKVLNVGTITEVDPGGNYSGSTVFGPHLFCFYLCVNPLLSRAFVDGWQMHVAQFSMCVNPLAERLYGHKPFRPTTAGHGYLVQFDRCNKGVTQDNVSFQTRHTSDFTQSYDCISQRNTAYAPYGVQFNGHGQGAKRCKSIDDTVHFGGGIRPAGWGWGNPSFAKDYDFDIIRPGAYGRCEGEFSCKIFDCTTGSEGMRIVDPVVVVSSNAAVANYTKVLVAEGGAKNISMKGGYVDMSAVEGSGSDALLDCVAAVSTSASRPRNVSIEGVRLKTGKKANTAGIRMTQLGGVGRVRDVTIETSVSTATGIVVACPLEELDIRDNRVINGGVRGVHVQFAPTKRYRVTENFYEGTFSTAQETLAAGFGTALPYKTTEYLTGSTSYNPTSLADGAGVTTTVTVNGAAVGDVASAGFALDLQGITLTAWVSAANTVAVRFQNETGGTLDLAGAVLRAVVFKP